MSDRAFPRRESGLHLPGYRGKPPGHGAEYGSSGYAAHAPGDAGHTRGGGTFGAESVEAGEAIDYAAFLRKLWRWKFTFIAVSVLVSGIASVFIMRMPAHYVAHAFVAIGDPVATRFPYGANQGTTPAALPDTGAVQTEVEILKSSQLAVEVIRHLKLDDNPEFNPAASSSKPVDILSRIKEWVFGAQAPSSLDAHRSQIVSSFLRNLQVSIKDNSRVIDVAFDSSDPQLAMQIANTIVDHYVNNQLELRSQSARRTAAWLRERITQLQAKVENAEKAVEKFRVEAGLFSTPAGSPLLLKQMTDVSAELATAQTARAALEARLSQFRASMGRGNRTPSDIVDSPFMRALDTQEADVQQRLAESSVSLGDKHPTTIGLRERLRNIYAAMRSEGVRVVASLENDLKVARMKEQDLSERLSRLQGDIARMNSSEITLRGLEREAEADRLVLNNFIARFKATTQESDTSSHRPDAQIVSYAQLPVGPDRPKRGLLILIAGVASLVSAAFLVHVVEKSDRSLHSLAEIEEHLKVAGLGMTPISKAAHLSAPEAARYGLAYREAVKAIYSHQNGGSLTARALSRLPVGRPGRDHLIKVRSDKRLDMVSEHNFLRPAKDAFSGPELDAFLREKGIDHLFLVGIDGTTSISRTACSALERGYRVTFIRDGIFTGRESKWERLLKSFESAAAFAITSEEFAEFCPHAREDVPRAHQSSSLSNIVVEDPSHPSGQDDSIAMPDNADMPWVRVSEGVGGTLTVTAILKIGGKKAALFLPDWLDQGEPDREAAANTDVKRAARRILEGLEPEQFKG